MVRYINLFDENWPCPWGSITLRQIMGKTLKKSCLITTRPTAYIFSIKKCLMVLYINCANHEDAPGVQIGHIHEGLDRGYDIHYSLKIKPIIHPIKNFGAFIKIRPIIH